MKRTVFEKIEFRKLCFSYNAEVQIFENLNFSFPDNKVLFLQGATGGGKTTLIKILMGLLRPTAGEFLINDKVMNDLTHSEFDFFRLNMGHAFDIGGLINNQSIYQNLRLPMDFHGQLDHQERHEKIIEYLRFFNLEDQMELRPAFVSSETQKAVALLRAFIMNPGMIILNDPTAGLDSELFESVVTLIKKHQQHHNLKQIVIVSENENLISCFEAKVVQVTKNQLVDISERKIKRVS
jgi:phospholipid/cholesterol/gamma-HCH transport system ATP-binding protein